MHEALYVHRGGGGGEMGGGCASDKPSRSPVQTADPASSDGRYAASAR